MFGIIDKVLKVDFNIYYFFLKEVRLLTTFNEIISDQEILNALDALEIKTPSEIQESAIPSMLEGIDLIGQAQTGTGKTFAYGIPVLLKTTKVPFESLILCPTRELSIQVSKELSKLLKFKKGISIATIYGGESYEKQIRALKSKPQIIVGTPGRIIDHMNRHTLDFKELKTLVLDEADEMLKMGFQEDLETILKDTPSDRQTVLFSATMPDFIKKIALNYQHNPKHIVIEKKTLTVERIKQDVYYCKRESKLDLLIRVLDYYSFKSCIIFANTKSKVDDIVSLLQKNKYSVDGLHGDLKQMVRDRVMNSFRAGHINLLVCTDVAARGIDVKGLEAIINFDLPQEDELYVHRIGRTGRAGNDGHSISFATESERKKVMFIERFTKSQMNELKVPSKEDIMVAQMNRYYHEVLDKVDEPVEPNLPIINKLAKINTDPVKIINALISLSYKAGNKEYPEIAIARVSRERVKERSSSKAPRSDSKGFVYAHLNIGKKELLRPQILISLAQRLAGVRKENIGDIVIRKSGTDLEITKNGFNYLQKLEGKEYNGTRIKVSKIASLAKN